MEKENVSLNNQLEGWRIRNESENKEINALKQTLSEMTENHDGNLKILVSTTKALEEVRLIFLNNNIKLGTTIIFKQK